jgi:hypothetical protein
MNGALQQIKSFIVSSKRKKTTARILDRVFVSGLCLFVSLIVLQVIFAFLPWVFLPLIWDLLAISEIVFVIITIIYFTFINVPTLIDTAREIESRCGLKHPLLSIAMEFDRSGKDNAFTCKTYENALQQLSSGAYVSSGSEYSVKTALAFFSVMALWVGSLFMQPSIYNYLKMPLTWFSGVNAKIYPGSIYVKRNSSVDLKMVPLKAGYPSVKLTIYNPENGNRNSLFLRPDSTGNFTYSMDSVKSSFIYQFSAGAKSCPAETITAVAPPSIFGLKIRITPPQYSCKGETNLPDGQGDFEVYAGSKVRWVVESNQLRSAHIIKGKDTTAMTVSGNTAVFESEIFDTARYTFAFTDTFNQSNDSLPVFSIGLMNDEPPLVQILKPGRNKNLSAEQAETLQVEAVDDLGINTLQLRWFINGNTETTGKWDISPVKRSAAVQKQLMWDISSLSLYPGDTLFYWAFVQDSKPFKPFQTANTDTFWFRVPGFEEIQKQISEQQDNMEEKVGDVKERQDNLEQMMKDLLKSSSGKEEQTWEQKQIMKDIKEQIKAQSDSLQSALNTLKETVKQLKDQGELGDEISKKMEQVQKTLEDLIKQYGDSLLGDLNKQQNFSMQEMKDAVEKAKEMLPELSDRLDNTLKYLKALKKDRELAELAMRAEKLAQEQSDLSSAKQDPKNIQRQKELLDRVEKFNKDLEKSMDDWNENEIKSSKESMEQIDSLNEEMKSGLQKNSMPSSAKMNQMSGSLLSMSQKLRSQMSSEKMRQLALTKEKLLDMTNDAMQLSDWQSQLRNSASDSSTEQSAMEQQSISDALKKSMANLDSLKMIPPDLKQQIRQKFMDAMNASESVLQDMEVMSGKGAMSRSETSMKSLANELLGALSSMDQQGGSQGNGSCDYPSAMRKLSGKQAAINAATGELLKSMLGNSQPSDGGSNGQSSENARKSAQDAQKAIADELKKLSDQYGSGEGGEAVKKRIEELEKEARQLAEMLSKPGQDLADRQDRFLSRMLQSALSMHRQDEGKEQRKSKSSEIIFSDQNGTIDGSINNSDVFYMMRKKALQGNYPQQYRTSVKAYFDTLGAMFLR